MVSQCFERAPSRPACGVAAGVPGAAVVAPELPCCEYCANVASGTANIAVSSAARSAVDFIVISLGETASGDQQTPCRQITDSLLAATALFRAVDLAQCCLQPVSQLLRVVIRPEMH